MIPISLQIEGLYSYQSAQNIDFTRLTEAQLFGIFGATGSGKSSILEAISFALYGQSERLNLKDNRGYNMMNLRSNRMLIDFEFETEDNRYKFVVKGKRNSKQFDKVATLERKAFVYKGAELVPMKSTDAEPLIGLSYENFKRTIIIPQGKFQEFLQLTETERTRMLKDIFKLEKFELYGKTVSLERKNQALIDQKTALINQLDTVTEEIIDAKTQEANQAEESATKSQKELQQREKSLAGMEELKQLFAKVSQQQEVLTQLESQQDAFASRRERLKKYERCLVDFKPLLDRKVELTTTLEQTTRTAKAKKTAFEQTKSELARAEETFKTLQEDYSQRDQFLQRAEELQQVIKIQELGGNVAAIDGRILKGNEVLAEMKGTIEGMKEKMATQTTQIRHHESQRPDLKKWMAIKEWFTQKKSLEQGINHAENQFKEKENLRLNLNQEKIDLLKSTKLSSQQYDLPVEQLIDLLKNRQSELEQSLTRTESEKNHALAQHQLSSFAANLEEGKPCPLCGAVHHPEVLTTGNTAYVLEKAEDAYLSFRNQKQELEKVLLRMELLKEQLNQTKNETEIARTALTEAQQLLDGHRAAFVWQDLTEKDDQLPQQKIQDLEKIEKNIADLRQEWDALETSVSKETEKLERYQQKLDELKQQRQQEEIQFQAQQKAFRHIDYQTYQTWERPAIERVILDQKDKYKNLEEVYRAAEGRTRQLRSHVDQLTGEISELEKQEKATTSRIAQTNQHIQDQIDPSPFEDVSSVIAILDQQLDLSAEKKAIEQFNQQLYTAKAALEELNSQVSGKSFDAEEYQLLQASIGQLKLQLSEQMVQLGGLRQELGQLEADMLRKKELQKEKDQLSLRGDNLKTLKNMFARSGFVNYVSTIYLQNLCLAANERFMKLTQGSLSLEPTDSNNFQVRDYLNNGQVRSVKTLSGGQTFQAALSLALSLADQIQQQAQARQNFFFLDEGFGSQDKNSLQVIFNTLKSLRKENRVVGVISHVEELQQEIGAYLHIFNDPEKGSRIEKSWE